MKTLNLNNKSWNRLLTGSRELYDSDFEGSYRSCIPGEWVLLSFGNGEKSFLAFVNPMVERGPIGRVLEKWSGDSSLAEQEVGESYIRERLNFAIERRKLLGKNDVNGRWSFGQADGLPGLIIDTYREIVLVQINSAGMDRHRNYILGLIGENFPNQKVLAFDQEKYRRNEGLPIYPDPEELPDFMLVDDNDFHLKLPKKLLQKVGYYYDHNANRSKLEASIKKANINFKRGLDLFCYAGTWGYHMLRGGVEHVEFVDQADMSEVVDSGLALNGFEGRGKFMRQDVFKFLDDASRNSLKFGIIVSDPPAFSKEEKNRKRALLGYEKLHAACLGLLEQNSFFVAASCTHGVSLEELDGTVFKAAIKKSREIQMLDTGIQANDHPFSSFKDNNNYIKYILYYVK